MQFDVSDVKFIGRTNARRAPMVRYTVASEVVAGNGNGSDENSDDDENGGGNVDRFFRRSSDYVGYGYDDEDDDDYSDDDDAHYYDDYSDDEHEFFERERERGNEDENENENEREDDDDEDRVVYFVAECPICLAGFAEGNQRVVTRPCGHMVHASCAETYRVSSGLDVCATCRTARFVPNQGLR